MNEKQLEFINYLFEKGFLDFDVIIDKYVNSGTEHTTHTLLKKIIEDYENIC